MDIPAQLNIPDYVYRFYMDAAQNIAGKTTEQIMADALTAYASLLNKDIMTVRNSTISEENDKSAM